MDLPTEVLESGIFTYLTRKELKGIRLNKRLKDIADSVIEKIDRKRNYKPYLLLHGKMVHFSFNVITRNTFTFIFRDIYFDSRRRSTHKGGR